MQLSGATIHWMKAGDNYLDFPIYHPIWLDEWYGNKGSIVFWNNQIKPDYQCFLCDSFMIKHLFEAKYDGDKKFFEKDRLLGKKLFYFPFDSQDVYTEAKPVIEGMDMLVAMSKFSQGVLKKDMGKDCFYIPHGCDTNIYRPIARTVIDNIRKENGWENKFVVGCVGRNQGRKMMPKLFDAFKIFSEGKDTVLFLHCHPKDPAGHDLVDYAKKIGIDKNVAYSGLISPYIGFPEAQVNVAYNCMDIHVLSTSGEGFGLPIIESMAAGIPNICPDYTTGKELLEGRGELAKVATYITGEKNTDRAVVDAEDLAKKMEKLYQDKNLRERYSKEGREFVLRNLSWEKVTRAWIELFELGEIREKFE